MIESHRFQPVQYDDLIHRYSFGDISYISATQLIERFKEPFDTEERSQYMEYRYGSTASDWRGAWKDINALSLVRGKLLHDEKEQMLLKELEWQKVSRPFSTRMGIDIPKELHYHLWPDGDYPEMLVWNHHYKIAGRMDKLALRTKPYNCGRIANIGDYKTNKKIRQYSWQDVRTKKYRMMLGPLSHLMDCEIVHYTLQLSLYQFMAEYLGLSAGTRTITHFPHEIEGLGTPDPIDYELPYYRNEVILMLEHNLRNTKPSYTHEHSSRQDTQENCGSAPLSAQDPHSPGVHC